MPCSDSNSRTTGSSTNPNSTGRAASSARRALTMRTRPERCTASSASLSSSATLRAAGQGPPARRRRRRREMPVPRKRLLPWAFHSSRAPSSSVRLSAPAGRSHRAPPHRPDRVMIPEFLEQEPRLVQLGLAWSKSPGGPARCPGWPAPGPAQRIGPAVPRRQHTLVEFNGLHEVVHLMARRGCRPTSWPGSTGRSPTARDGPRRCRPSAPSAATGGHTEAQLTGRLGHRHGQVRRRQIRVGRSPQQRCLLA